MASDSGFLEIDGLRAYVSHPQQRTGAGVLVLPAIVGIGEHITGVCAQLNAAGLTALAWDPHTACDPSLPVVERARFCREEMEDRPAQQEQLRWLDYMHRELGLASVGVIGYCLGGRMQLTLCAVEPRLKACVAYHPSIEDQPPARHLDAVALARDIPCPVQLMYPGQDRVTSRQTFLALREALESRPAPTIVHEYPKADHGFTEHVSPLTGEDRRDNPANPAAAALAWPQTAAFFRACLLGSSQ